MRAAYKIHMGIAHLCILMKYFISLAENILTCTAVCMIDCFPKSTQQLELYSFVRSFILLGRKWQCITPKHKLAVWYRKLHSNKFTAILRMYDITENQTRVIMTLKRESSSCPKTDYPWLDFTSQLDSLMTLVPESTPFPSIFNEAIYSGEGVIPTLLHHDPPPLTLVWFSVIVSRKKC